MVSTGEYVYAVVLFCFSSVGMMMGNKLAVNALPLPCSLVIIQSIGTLLLLFFFRDRITGMKVSYAKEWIPIATLFTLMLYTSLKSFVYVNVSTVIILRNIGAIITTITEYLVRGELVNMEILVSEGTIVLGAYWYGRKSAEFNWQGLFWVMVNVCGQTAYGVLLKHYMTVKPHFTSMSKYSMSFLNNLMALPLLGIIGIGEVGEASSALENVTMWGWFWIAVTCGLGFMISTSGFGLQKLVSATTFIVINNLVKFFNIVLGVVLMGDAMGVSDGIGCATALLGGAWYSSAVYRFHNSASYHHAAVGSEGVDKEKAEINASAAATTSATTAVPVRSEGSMKTGPVSKENESKEAA